MTQKHQKHIPVLLSEVISLLSPRPKQSYLDLTAGYGGHAQAVLAKTKEEQKAVLVDRDSEATAELSTLFNRARIINSDFFQASEQLLRENTHFDLILADLGVSSPHLDKASRGFSIKNDGPLDMRMDKNQELSAQDVVNKYSKEKLMSILRKYGEEPKAARIAQKIMDNRPIKTTEQLAKIVASVYPKRKYGAAHPATKTFQALRIEVNNELELLSQSLPLWVELLKPGGRLAVITFHSLEDRIVKNFFTDLGFDNYDSTIMKITKKPISGNDNELVFNPRARSAKLRIVAKINNKKKG